MKKKVTDGGFTDAGDSSDLFGRYSERDRRPGGGRGGGRNDRYRRTTGSFEDFSEGGDVNILDDGNLKKTCCCIIPYKFFKKSEQEILFPILQKIFNLYTQSDSQFKNSVYWKKVPI